MHDNNFIIQLSLCRTGLCIAWHGARTGNTNTWWLLQV